MPDICMCDDYKCQQRMYCRRYRMTPWRLQSWFMESPREGDECEYFLPGYDKYQQTLSACDRRAKHRRTKRVGP